MRPYLLGGKSHTWISREELAVTLVCAGKVGRQEESPGWRTGEDGGERLVDREEDIVGRHEDKEEDSGRRLEDTEEDGGGRHEDRKEDSGGRLGDRKEDSARRLEER